LEKLRQEVREEEVERKIKAFTKEQIEKKIAKIGLINWRDLCRTFCFTRTYSRKN
jgi:hypothetical protein